MEQLNILMTGGARGIGAGIMEKLTQAGHNLAFCGRRPLSEFAEQTAAMERETGVKVRYYQPPDERGVLTVFY